MSDKSSGGKEKSPFDRRSTAMRSLSKKIRGINFPNLKGHDEHSKSLSRESSLRDKKSTTDGCSGEVEFQPIKDMSAYYLSYHEARLPGLDETIETATKIYNHHKPYLKSRPKSLISIDKDGITIKEAVPIRRQSASDATNENETATETEILYKSRRIIYCGVDKLHQKLFMFNYQHGARPENIHIHVIVCKTRDDAKSIAKALKQIFQFITKVNHQNEKEEKRRHQEAIKDTMITKSSTSLQRYQSYKSTNSSNTSSKESCSVGCGSGEWISDGDNVCVSSIA